MYTHSYTPTRMSVNRYIRRNVCEKMKGKYYLDEIDGVLHSTDSYEIYVLYNKMFNNYDVILKEKLEV